MEKRLAIISTGIGSIICLVIMVAIIQLFIEMMKNRNNPALGFSGLFFFIGLIIFAWGSMFILGGLGVIFWGWDWKIIPAIAVLPFIYRFLISF